MELGRKNLEVSERLGAEKLSEKEKDQNLEQNQQRMEALDAQVGIEKPSEPQEGKQSEKQDCNGELEDKRAEKTDHQKTESEQVFHSSFSDKIKDHFSGKESSYDVKRAEAHGLEKGCFDAVPREYREAVYQRFENAPDEIKKFINKNDTLEEDKKLKVGEVLGDEYSMYHVENKLILMEKGFDKEEYAAVFSHEYGHYFDDMHSQFSNRPDFQNAVKNDLEQYDKSTLEGRKRFDRMLDALFSSDAKDDQMISDNLSAYLKNDSEIIDRYDKEYRHYYGHENDEWEKEGMCEAEIYANSFSICVSDNKDSISFMEEYFPKTWSSFGRSIKEEW